MHPWSLKGKELKAPKCHFRLKKSQFWENMMMHDQGMDLHFQKHNPEKGG